jgi:hypothetical protein
MKEMVSHDIIKVFGTYKQHDEVLDNNFLGLIQILVWLKFYEPPSPSDPQFIENIVEDDKYHFSDVIEDLESSSVQPTVLPIQIQNSNYDFDDYNISNETVIVQQSPAVSDITSHSSTRGTCIYI